MKEDNGLKFVFVVLVALTVILIVYAACCRHSCDAAETGENEAYSVEADKTTAWTSEAEKRAFFEAVAKVVYFRDGVLTVRRAYEQETSEKETDTRDGDRDTAGDLEHEERAAVETVCESTEERAEEQQPSLTDLYPNIPTEYLTEMAARLHAYGIDWFLPYAVATMFQESRCNPNAENANGLDKGLLQYRITYWPSVCREHGFDPNTSIFDWRVQIAIYAADAARRLHSGLSVEETVSRHNTSDYGAYNPVYVAQVMQWVR